MEEVGARLESHVRKAGGPRLGQFRMMLHCQCHGQNRKSNWSATGEFKEAGGLFKNLAQRKAIGTPAPGIVPRSNGRAGGNGTTRPAKWPAGAESGSLAAGKATGSASAGAT